MRYVTGQGSRDFWYRLHPLSIWLINIGLIFTLVACSQSWPQTDRIPASPSQTAPLLVAAAASLQPALAALTPQYNKAHPKQTLRYTFAASGVLQQQIAQGAPVDVFIAAAAKPMDALQQQGLLAPETRRDLLTNQIVLITPRPVAIPITQFQDLTQPSIQRLAIGEPRTVPAGQYAIEILQHLQILEAVRSKFVFGSSVKAVLAAVENGAVDAGIVYISDVQRETPGSEQNITIAALANPQWYSLPRYPIALLKSSPSPVQGKQYIEFLRGGAARAVFQAYGFGIASP